MNGVKMSKSRGTFITAKTYSELLDPEYLRYYLAAKLNGSVDDVDFNLEDFVLRTNSDLVGKVINIASRCSGFIEKDFEKHFLTTSRIKFCSTIFSLKQRPLPHITSKTTQAKP